MTLRALQFGATGQIARELIARAPGRGVELAALSRADVNLTDARAVEAAVRASRADIVINAAAYTAVDQAEAEEDLARVVNADAPAAMARAAAARGAALLHVSTDYVFDGANSGPYREDDPPAPTGAYGRTKLAGEEAVAGLCRRHVIVRTAWVHSPHGRNFVKTMLRLAGEREMVRVVDDQRGSPTAAGDVADALLTITAQVAEGSESWGVHHLTGAGSTTWAGFAEAIFEDAGDLVASRPRIEPISTEDFPTPALRPANSRLDCSRIARDFGVEARPWREGLAATLAGLAAARALTMR